MPHQPPEFACSPFERRLLTAASLLLGIGLLLLLGVQPLYLEEPRRAFITLELLRNGNLLVPTQLGELYFNKPPVFNWILLASTTLFGGFSEWALRLPTVLSTAALAFLIGRWGTRRAGLRLGWYSALLFLTSGSILFYFSTLAEIDLFYSLITFAAISCIYHLEKSERYLTLFLTVYALTAVGFLTKGLPSLAFTAISLLAWFVYRRKFVRLLYWQHFAGIGLLALLVGAYTYGYAQYEDPLPYFKKLLFESGSRTVAGQKTTAFLVHLVAFPLNFLANLIPASLLLVFAWKRKVWQTILQHDWLVFCLLMLGANILVYWLSPGTRMRYVYMLFPFAIYPLVYAWQLASDDNHTLPHRVFRWIALTLTVLFGIGMTALNIIEDLDFLAYRLPLSLSAALLTGLLGGYLWKKRIAPLPAIILLLALGRIVFDLTVLPQRAHDSGAQQNRELAGQIHELIGDAPLYNYCDDKAISFTTTFYLNRMRSGNLTRKDEFVPGDCILVRKPYLPDSARILLEYPYDKRQWALIRVP